MGLVISTLPIGKVIEFLPGLLALSVIDISDFYNEKLEFFPVSTYVNSVKNDSPQCIKKLNGVDNLNLFSNKI